MIGDMLSDEEINEAWEEYQEAWTLGWFYDGQDEDAGFGVLWDWTPEGEQEI